MQAAVTAIITAIVTFALTYFLYYSPTMAFNQEQLRIAQQNLKIAEQNAEDARRRANKAENDLDQIRAQWKAARNKFVYAVTAIINDTNKPETAWEGKPHPSPQEFARQIVEARDELRRQINEMKADLDNVSNSLDSDIDALGAAMDPPPADAAQFTEILKRLNGGWPTKVRLIDNLVEKTFLQLGCPRLVASNP